MQKLVNNPRLSAIISGVLAYVAICQINFFLSWICYVPLFISIHNKSARQVLKIAVIYGFTFSCFAFFWMIPGAERFTGYSMFYGLAIFLGSAFFYSVFCAALFYCFTSIKRPGSGLKPVILNAVLAAALFCIAEALLTFVSTGLPWFDVHSGNGLAENLFAVQPAALFGVHVMTFVAVAVNYLFAAIAIKKLWFRLYIPVAIAAAYLLTGFLLLQNFNNNLPSNKSFNVAILAENISPDIKWDDNTGNVLVQKLLDLNKVAVKQKPDMALWSESAIPWTYKKDDDLVMEILRITNPGSVTHFLGINTAWKDNQVFNSAYCIIPGGNVTGRYDKQYLLSFIEQPLNGWLMPFFSSQGYTAVKDEEHSNPVTTPYGKAGVLICNEAAIPAAAASQVKKGAEFLFNMSNDGWFSDTYIVRLHYYYARLRAVESRKDLAINCNNGFSGLVKASGNIEVKEKSNEAFVEMVSIQPNQYLSLASSHPRIFIYGCIIYVITIIISFIAKNKTTIS